MAHGVNDFIFIFISFFFILKKKNFNLKIKEKTTILNQILFSSIHKFKFVCNRSRFILLFTKLFFPLINRFLSLISLIWKALFICTETHRRHVYGYFKAAATVILRLLDRVFAYTILCWLAVTGCSGAGRFTLSHGLNGDRVAYSSCTRRFAGGRWRRQQSISHDIRLWFTFNSGKL